MRKSCHVYIQHASNKSLSCYKRSSAAIISLLKQVEVEKRSSSLEQYSAELHVPVTFSAQPLKESTVLSYTVLWGKKSTKKHKTFEGDGVLEVSENSLKLCNESGAVIGTSRNSAETNLEIGSRISIGNKDVEIVDVINREVVDKKVIKIRHNNCNSNQGKRKFNENATRPFKMQPENKPLVFPRPANEHQWLHNSRKSTVRDVVLDSFLNAVLRPHQREGVVFLYECVMGFRNPGYFGAILADEMGLGKTLQCVALTWTLLKHGPYGIPICKKVIVITPSSLCANWNKEFVKWLRKERIQTYVVAKSNRVPEFTRYPLIPVMIISYEQFVRSFSDVEQIDFDLVICDEGHRLKNSSVKAAQLLIKLKCKKRILLTGTPVQNDLEEYFSVVNVVNSGILGTYSEFRKTFELPILAAQELNCSESVKRCGEEKAASLNRLVSKFILRRTNEIMRKYLPTKQDFIICCRLSNTQKELYNEVLNEWFNSEDKNPFSVISKLRKICNHPCLCDESIPKKLDMDLFVGLSGKLIIADSILNNALHDRENIVLVSYFTKFLDLLEILCNKYGLPYLRLDGSTPVGQRKTLVESFNNNTVKVFLLSARAGGTGLNLTGAARLILTDGDWNPSNDLQAIARIWRDGQKKSVKIYRLISTGTIEEKIYQRQLSKLGLSDSVDNPENVQTVLKFSEEELKDLFTPDFNTSSLTHDLLECTCMDSDGFQVQKVIKPSIVINKTLKMSCLNQLTEWEHGSPPFTASFLKSVGLNDDSNVSFVFHKKTD